MNQADVEKLIELVVDANLTVPVNINSEVNKKFNAIEGQLVHMGINPRCRKFTKL